MKKLLLSVASAAVLLGAGTAQAEVETYNFDQEHTQILFFVDHLGFSKSQGEFHQVDGVFKVDRDNLASSMIDVSIKTDSLDMDMGKWDDHMKSADFFNVEQFPEMTFKSTSVEVTGEDAAKITGDLTILETTKPVVLDVVHNKSGKHPFSGKFVAGFSATTSIKRSDFGMNYGLPAIGDDIEIRLEIEGIREGDAPAE